MALTKARLLEHDFPVHGYNPPTPLPDKPPRPSHRKKLDFGPFRLRLLLKQAISGTHFCIETFEFQMVPMQLHIRNCLERISIAAGSFGHAIIEMLLKIPPPPNIHIQNMRLSPLKVPCKP